MREGYRRKRTRCLREAWSSVISVRNKTGRNSYMKKNVREHEPRKGRRRRGKGWSKIGQDKERSSREGQRKTRYLSKKFMRLQSLALGVGGL
jgi:hypothetical protein